MHLRRIARQSSRIADLFPRAVMRSGNAADLWNASLISLAEQEEALADLAGFAADVPLTGGRRFWPVACSRILIDERS